MPNYRTFLRKKPEGGFTVIVPSLYGCISHGETLEIATQMAKEAIELYSETAHPQDVRSDEDVLEYTVTVNDHG